MKKFAAVIVTAIVMSVFSAPAYAAPVPSALSLAIDVVSLTPSFPNIITAGGTFTVNVKVRNPSAENAASAVLSLPAGLNTGSIGLPGASSSYIGDIPAGGESSLISMTFTTEAAMPGGVYPLEFSVTAKDSLNNDVSASVNYSVRIAAQAELPGIAAAEAPVLVIDNLAISSRDVRYGDTFVISGIVRNTSANYAYNARVAVSGGLTAGSVELPNAATNQNLGILYNNGGAPFSFTFLANADVLTGSYPITFKATAQYGGGDSVSEENTYSVHITGKKPGDAETVSPTALTVENMRVSVSDIKAGGTFQISGEVHNASAEQVTNTKIAVTGGLAVDGIGIPNALSSTLIGGIAPGRSGAFSFTFRAEETLATGSYPITFSVNALDASGKLVTEENTFSVRITGNPKPAAPLPSLVIEKMSVDNKTAGIAAGGTFKISGSVRNSSAVDVNSVKIAVTGGLSVDGIGIPNAPSSKVLDRIKAGQSAEFSFTFRAEESLATGSYPITFSADGGDADGEAVSGDYIYSVRVIGKTDAANPASRIEITNVTSPGGIYEPGQQFTGNVTVRNTGKAAAKNVRVEVKTDAAIVPKSANVSLLTSLAPSESRTLTFSFMPTADALTRFYVLEFAVSEADVVLASQFGGVNVVNPEKQEEENAERNKSIPKIIISNYVVTSDSLDTPEIVMAGHEFDLFLEFKNTHPTKTVSNIKVTLSTPPSGNGDKGNTFSVVGGSNTIFVEDIAPGHVYQKTLRMYSILSAAAKNHIISVHFAYEDAEGNPITQDEEVGVTVTQEAKLETGNIYMPSMMNVGDQNYLYFSLQNTGRVTLFNVKAYLEGDGFDLSGSEVIIGNMAAGAYQSYDSNFSASEPGTHTLKVLIQYDLDTGKRVVTEQEFDIEVVGGGDVNADMGGISFDGGDMSAPDGGDGESGGFPLVFIIGIPALAAIVIAVVIVIVVKKRKKSARADDDE